MLPPRSNDVSSATSSTLFDFELPAVSPGEGPQPPKAPSYERARAHALFLLRSKAAGSERSRPNPEPFVLD